MPSSYDVLAAVDVPTDEETFGHARFFWRNALSDVKSIAEGG
jgi:hypothetical protein